MRIGQGIDVHAFSEDSGRPLVLGGMIVPGAPGLAGHSDGDVATHALIDACLGAAGLGDIGRHFPSTEQTPMGIPSATLLERTLDLVAEVGFVVSSGDVTIVAQRPTLAPHLETMAKILSARVGAPISVKATTTDHLGFTGRGEGMAAFAVILLNEP